MRRGGRVEGGGERFLPLLPLLERYCLRAPFLVPGLPASAGELSFVNIPAGEFDFSDPMGRGFGIRFPA